MVSNLNIISNLIQERLKAEKLNLKREHLKEYFKIRSGLGKSILYQVIYILLTIVERKD